MQAVFLIVVATVGAPALKDRPTPPPIVGEWEAERFTAENHKVMAFATGTFANPRPRCTFTADGRMLEGGRAAVGFTIDLKASPPTIALSQPAEALEDTSAAYLTGTFRIEGDVLTLTLSTGSEGLVSTTIYRRVKKE